MFGIGTLISDVEGGFGSIESDVAGIPEIGVAVGGIQAGIVGVENLDTYLDKELPNFKNALGMIPTAITYAKNTEAELAGLPGDLEGYFKTGLSDLKATTLAGLAGLQGGITQLENDFGAVETYEKEYAAMAPEVTLIDKEVGAFPMDLVDFWNTTAMPDIRGALGDISPEISALSSDIDALKTKIGGLEADITKLGSELTTDVEDAVIDALKVVWKDIEIPVIAIGGLFLYLLLFPRCCNQNKSAKKVAA